MTNNTETLREVALGFSTQKVTAMTTKIEQSFDRRDQFEAANGIALAGRNSYTVERDRMLKNKIAVARLFLALSLEPSNVIERKVSSNAMFNAKALKKITEIAQFVVGFGAKLERVTKAFIACALIATDNKIDVITNATNRKFLCSAGFTGQVTDQELIDHLDELRLRSMTSGAETQSSQVRNVLDVLGLGEIRSTDKPRDAIVIHADNGFYSMFRKAFMK